MTEKAEDLGEPVAYLVLREGVPAYAPSGDTFGTVAHVLADEQEDVFHGLVINTPDGPRVAPAAQVEGLFEKGVIVTGPLEQLPRPEGHQDSGLKRAWDWLVQPR
ncbi:hypothetical protein [Actinoplanes siamensis]|uniref:Uncharacterized protein n=1 Tax=Actinoplanes siamensis TaxID=1223317 RepID=A0A919N9F1_9ACTN|nr:hypothetical protein [Actinoplanes siamensis]GIF06680.1 hypothetical protein Asi03nite_42180 [Actinoplanes siamensis]